MSAALPTCFGGKKQNTIRQWEKKRNRSFSGYSIPWGDDSPLFLSALQKLFLQIDDEFSIPLAISGGDCRAVRLRTLPLDGSAKFTVRF